ncbi:hypothetical protein KJK34_03340 [Flavobacterium sp. D11R37]|uniref:hypothetical protein n=1 Tax=Flavobacterium coralii TaxID=2838017 RepID=UPI001CA6345A|nr:hypothetical protein [Flavobacterium coralii]MBY8961781.1 hypothetical protein [Flavobacterium coralii]
MAIKDLNTLKEWFSSGKKPKQNNYWDWLDSYWHKDETISQDDIQNLPEALDQKTQKSEFEAHVTDLDAHNLNSRFDAKANVRHTHEMTDVIGLDDTVASLVVNNATSTQAGKIKLAGDLSGTAETPIVQGLTAKLNKDANAEYEHTGDNADTFAPALLSRTGGIFRSGFVKWFEKLKVLSIDGSLCQIEPNESVTDGNMVIKGITGAAESLRFLTGAIPVASYGIDNSSPVFRFFCPVQYVADSAINETHFITSSIAQDGVQNLKEVVLPNNSIITVDIQNIAIMDIDGNYITGKAQFSFTNTGGKLSAIGNKVLNYNEQYSSYIDSSPTETDTRLQAVISHSSIAVQFVNTQNKPVNINCRIEYNIVTQPIAE